MSEVADVDDENPYFFIYVVYFSVRLNIESNMIYIIVQESYF